MEFLLSLLLWLFGGQAIVPVAEIQDTPPQAQEFVIKDGPKVPIRRAIRNTIIVVDDTHFRPSRN
ncbi:MAG: hypothetical protein AAF206_17025 [Bacteroidota bacterium]